MFEESSVNTIINTQVLTKDGDIITITIHQYKEEDEKQWDDFVLKESINGTFLQTRNFLNYHPINRFKDCSILMKKGNAICAVIPACEIINGTKKFISHKGSTYGGIVISKKHYSITGIKEIMESLLDYLKENNYDEIILKCTSPLYSKENMELIDYYLYHYGFTVNYELNFFIDYSNVDNVEDLMSHNKKNYYKRAVESGLHFIEITDKDQIEQYYYILENNLKKYDKKPVHSIEELYDLYYNRIKNNVKFFAVFKDSVMIAGTMLFIFDNTLHTQYMATDSQYLDLYPSYFLYEKVIEYGKNESFDKITFGIATEDEGRYLNEGLAIFKEGFGAKYSINKTYHRVG